MPPLLEVKNLTKLFLIRKGIFRKCVGAVHAVNAVDFHIEEREIVGIVGESGSGKSTAARAALRLIPPTSGSIQFLGRDFLSFTPSELRKARQDIQMIFQDPLSSLNPRKNLLDNIGEALLYHRIVKNRAAQIERVQSILAEIGLPKEAMSRYPHQFSGGQQQRISIGRAIAMYPKLIVCDESVSALDLSVQAQILNLLYELKEKFNLSYLFISHDLGVVRAFCDRVYVMEKGKVVESGSVEEIFQDPKHAYTQRLLRLS